MTAPAPAAESASTSLNLAIPAAAAAAGESEVVTQLGDVSGSACSVKRPRCRAGRRLPDH